MNKIFCRICGLPLVESPWGDDGNSPNFEICICCGGEFGNDDYSAESIKRYREKWANSGYKWFDSSVKPQHWSAKEQLLNIEKG